MHDSYLTADWSVTYLPESGPDGTWRLLQSMRLVNWNWDVFIWDLKDLLRLLTKAPAEFNYLFLTAFVKARAAYLAASGPFDCGQHAVLIGLGAKRVQFASIYYRLLLETLQDVLGSEDGERLIGDRDERLFQLAISAMERRYIDILVVIALTPEMDGTLYGQEIESWISGMVLHDGKLVSATPGPVEVRALTQCFGRHRLVRPSARDLVKKILRSEPMRSFLERTGPMTRTDIALEKLSRHRKLSGYRVVKYGDMEVQYYVTLTNATKTTLYVVCADRTMRIHQQNGVAPGSCPKTIEAADVAGTGEELYVVTFDNGVSGIFTIDFRPQKENEHSHVPPGVCNSTMFYVVDQAARAGDAEARRLGDSAHAKAEVTSEQSGVKTVQGTRDRVEHKVEKPCGSGRVRVNLTVDTDGLVAGAGKDDISNVELKSHLDKRLDSVTREGGKVVSAVSGARREIMGEVQELMGAVVQSNGASAHVRKESERRKATIEEMSAGPDRFLAGMRARISEPENLSVFMFLIEKTVDNGRERFLSYAEIGERFEGISKQAVSTRAGRLKAKYPEVWEYVRAVREPGKAVAFSALSPSERRKRGIDETYNYDAQ